MSKLKICAGKSCSDHGSKYLADRATAEQPDLAVEFCGCLGACQEAPNIKLNDTLHSHITGPKLAKLINKQG